MYYIEVIQQYFFQLHDWFWRISNELEGWDVWPFSLHWVIYGFDIVAGACASIGFAIWDVGDWIRSISEAVGEFLSWETILSNILSYLHYIGDLTTVFLYFVWNVLEVITSWWADISSLVQGWIDDANTLLQGWIDYLFSWLTTLQAAWDAFKDKIPSIDEIIAWWSNWWALILAQIIAWGALTALQIQSLIDSAFAAYAPFWEGWQDWRDSVIQFFTDPWAWLYDRFDDFIERFW